MSAVFRKPWHSHLNPAMFGGVGDGVHDDTAAVNAAISRTPNGGAVHLMGRTWLVTGINDTYGREFVGGGAIVVAVAGGGFVQLNSYADKGKVLVGAEYLYRVFQRIKVGGDLTIHLFGDSTVATAANGGGYAGPNFEPQVLLTNAFIRDLGIRNNIAITNHAVGGTRWVDANPVPQIDDVNGTTDLFIFKYEINDQQDGLDGFIANMRAKLSAVRANSHGTIDQLAVIVMGPNATYDPQHLRTNVWSEQLRGPLVKACRDMGCAYFDTYGYMRDATWAPGKAISDDFGDGQGVHPLETWQTQIWGKLVNEIMTSSQLEPYVSDAWTPITALNGWAYYGSGTPGYYASMSKDGWVSVRGVLSGGTVGVNQPIAQVPASLAPQFTELFSCATESGSCVLRVSPSGVIDQGDTNANATYTSLSGIRYKVRG